MKKIDLHIHTVPSPLSDRQFIFSLDNLREYVKKLEIDCIAITNHNLFDLEQFKQICAALEVMVLPGIEIDLEKGHLLLISENTELDDFNAKCKMVNESIKNQHDFISVEELKNIFPNLGRYLLIPHYEKSPNISQATLEKLHPHVVAGEVTSARKFKSCLREDNKLVPVIFSDARITTELSAAYPTRQTFIDVAEVSLRGIKLCLSDKAKVCLSKAEGNSYFQVTDDGLFLSTGLNIILGERSTGKTFTLERIMKSSENVKYIRQFSLLQNDEEKFKTLLSTRHSTVNELFLKEFKDVVSDMKNIDIRRSRNEVDKYLTSLLKFAAESDKQDSFSKAKLFSETAFIENDTKTLAKLIDATATLIENKEYRDTIDKYLPLANLKKLIIELIHNHTAVSEANLKRRWLNDIVSKIKGDLKLKTSTTPPIDIDFYEIILENEKVKKFNQVVQALKNEREIDKKEIQGFKVVARTKKYTGAQQMKTKSGRQLTFSEAFQKYDNPYGFLQALKDIELAETEYHKYFVDIEYKTLNKHDFPVSGGERSEFNLLHEIGDALQYDLLLIDEPESSFDNLFLKNDVNDLLKAISREVPVIIVTHNNTVGASIKPDFIVYTKKSINGNEVKYQVFSGYPSDKKLKCADGDEIDNYEVLLSCLEAGQQAYNDRRTNTYEILKN